DPADTQGHSKQEAEIAAQKLQARLSELQEVLYAQKQHALLIVLQAMDAGGKDGTIRHVFTGVNPQGCSVTSFKAPSAEELVHDPTKQWKVNLGDFEERKRWKDYMAAYEDALSKCSTEAAPWYVIPADRKWFRNLAVSRIIVDALEGLKLKYPKPTFDLAKVA